VRKIQAIRRDRAVPDIDEERSVSLPTKEGRDKRQRTSDHRLAAPEALDDDTVDGET
jgi:hypothetical protein